MISDLNDFLEIIKKALDGLGLEAGLTELIIGLLSLLSLLILGGRQVFLLIKHLIKYIIQQKKNRILAKDLHPFYSDKEIDLATKYYINTNFQNVPPSEDEEPGRHYITAATQPLIPLFLDKAFENTKDDSKYFLVLADSGMGKTTFMINLYLAYKFKRVWPWQKPKYDIKLFPMGNPETMLRLREMPTSEKENCILLLDAFDEDNEAIVDYKKRLNEVLDLVWGFREIVVTCRTQFFPSSKSEPTETGKFKFGPEPGQYHFQKIYISAFSEDDIKKYLKKRFRSIIFFNSSSKYLKALEIVLKSPNLMMRPMLLSRIDDLISINTKITYGFQVYEILIDQWLTRESNKAGIILKYGESYKQLLYEFSKALARYLYLNRKKSNNKLSLKVGEIIDNPNGLQLKDIEGNQISIDKYDQGSRSLLNRNAVGEYKFSHKSILEYFLALEAIENETFKDKFHFDQDLDASKKFFLEMLRFKYLNNENIDIYGSEKLGIKDNEMEYMVYQGYKSMEFTDIFKSIATNEIKTIRISFMFFIFSLFYIFLGISKLDIGNTFTQILYVMYLFMLITSSYIIISRVSRVHKIYSDLSTNEKTLKEFILILIK